MIWTMRQTEACTVERAGPRRRGGVIASLVYGQNQSLQDTADGIRAIRVGNARRTEACRAEADGTFVMSVSVTFSLSLVTFERTLDRSHRSVRQACFHCLFVDADVKLQVCDVCFFGRHKMQENAVWSQEGLLLKAVGN